MKQLLMIFIGLVLNINLFGQIRNFADIPKEILNHLDKMGIDSSQTLNTYEGDYLNFVYDTSLSNDFNLINKKVGFITNNRKSSKKEYFDKEKDRFLRNVPTNNNGVLYIFDTKQKEESGGYDAVIVYWSKIAIPIEDLIKKLQ